VQRRLDQVAHLGHGQASADGVPGQPALVGLTAQRHQLQSDPHRQLAAVDHVLDVLVEVEQGQAFTDPAGGDADGAGDARLGSASIEKVAVRAASWIGVRSARCRFSVNWVVS